MEHLLELSHYRRAKVWLDEAPLAEFAPTSTVTSIIPPEKVVDASRRTATVELYVPHGAKVSYALIGAELTNASCDGLEVKVLIKSEGYPYELSLASQIDDVRIGLLEEYASAVVDGVAGVAKSSGVPRRADLQFRWAAYGMVGSSPWVFRKVSAMVVRLLTLSTAVSDERIRMLVEHELSTA
jgi:hypothetical protein